MKKPIVVLIVTIIVIVAGLNDVYSGLFKVAADGPHWSITSRFLETLREQSIAARADDIQDPRVDEAIRSRGRADA